MELLYLVVSAEDLQSELNTKVTAGYTAVQSMYVVGGKVHLILFKPAP